eukprot:jgi/Hompol1/5698/HPOL_001946-RA
MQEEERFTGSVKRSTYAVYIKAAGGPVYVIFALTGCILFTGSASMTDMWLAFWTSNQFSLEQQQYLNGYTGLGGIQAVFAPLLAVISVLYYLIFRVFQKTNRELRRLMSIEKSPLMSHISETLSGMSTIRACSAQPRFLSRQITLLDNSNRPSFLKFNVEIWLRLRLEVLSCSLIMLLGVLGVTGFIGPSVMGLALTYATQIASSLNMVLYNAGNIEAEVS